MIEVDWKAFAMAALVGAVIGVVSQLPGWFLRRRLAAEVSRMRRVR